MITSLLALPLQFINASSSEYGNEKIDQLLFDIVEDYKEAIKGNITLSMRKFSTFLNVSRIFFLFIFLNHIHLIMGKIEIAKNEKWEKITGLAFSYSRNMANFGAFYKIHIKGQ